MIVDCENPQFIVRDIWYRPLARFPDYHVLMEATRLTKDEIRHSIETGRCVRRIRVEVDKGFAISAIQPQKRPSPQRQSLRQIAREYGLSLSQIERIKRSAIEKLRMAMEEA